MRRFTIELIGNEGDIDPWLDTGFVRFIAGEDDEGRSLRPDALFIAADKAGWEGAAAGLWPKVVVVAALLPALPGEIAEDYRLWRWRSHGFNLALASRLEALLAEPLWVAYHQAGRLTRAAAVKATADAVYRHLLADVFRETAEWCGHTFSVVTNM